MTPYRHALTAIALAASQMAVAQTSQTVPAPGGSNIVTESSGAVKPGAAGESSANTTPAKTDRSSGEGNPPAPEPRFILGNDRVIAPAKPIAALQGAPLSFNFEEAPVSEVVRTILGDILKTDYVLHPPLNGTVTLATRVPIAPDQAVFLLESSLQANGLAMVRDARGTYHVGRPDALKAIGVSVRQISSAPLTPGSGAIIVPLQYIGAAEMASILRPMVPPDAIVRVDNMRNLLILNGTRTQAEGWLDLVNTFDIDLLKGMSVGVFPLKHASINEVETALRLVSGGGAVPTATPGRGSTTGSTAPVAAGSANAQAAAGAASLGENNPLFGALRIMPIERINSIMVVTPRASYLEEARRWIEKLDQPSDSGNEPQLFIYQVQNGNAAHLSSVLNGIFGGGSGFSQIANSGVAPGLGGSSANSFGQSGSTGFGTTSNAFAGGGGYGGGFGRSSGSSLAGGGGFGNSFSSSNSLNNSNSTGNRNSGQANVSSLGGNLGIRVMADELNNSVLVWSTRMEYAKIESSLKRLDLPPTQVLIEASIIEVTLNDNLQYGLQWAFSNDARSGYSGSGSIFGTPAFGDNVTPGFSYTLRNAAGVIKATLTALAEKSLVKMISSPSLMVLDNHTAAISVGDQTPVRTSTTSFVDNPNATTSNIQYKDTGVNLSVTPSVNAGNIVSMQLDQTVTDVGNVDTPTGQRSFLQRQISSKVAVRSGESIVMGGLIKDNSNTGRSGVPLLQDVPLLGNLFRSNTVTGNRTELIVIITPRVVRNDVDIREVSEDLRDRLKGLRAIELQERGSAAPLPSPRPPVQSLPTQ